MSEYASTNDPKYGVGFFAYWPRDGWLDITRERETFEDNVGAADVIVPGSLYRKYLEAKQAIKDIEREMHNMLDEMDACKECPPGFYEDYSS